jgi:hypothetical protein
MHKRLNMKKIILFVVLTPIALFLVLAQLYILAFRIPHEILQNEEINGLSNYTGNEKDFAKYAIRQVAPIELYTGARIVKIYYGDLNDKNNCIGNDGSYKLNTNIKIEIERYGLFGLQKCRSSYTGCISP